MFAFSFIRRHILKLPCSKISSGVFSESGLRIWYRPFRMEENPVKCYMCGVNYHSEADRLRHLEGKRHKSTFDEGLGILNKAVEARWDCKWVDYETLHEYFSQFGKIERFYYNQSKTYALCYFDKASIVQKILQKKDHVVNGYSIKISKRIINDRTKVKRPVKAMEIKGASHAELMVKLKKLNTMSEQMRVIRETIRLTPIELNARKKLAENLTTFFKPYIPGSSVCLFGSSINGFDMKGSDIDLFLDLNRKDVDPKTQGVVVPGSFMNLLPKGCRSESFNFYDLNLKDKIRFTGNLLRSHRSFSCNVVSITGARCPVVKFRHVPTGLDCDISISNRLALKNSKLLLLYGNLDDRVKDLVYTVRYWGNIHKISGNPAGLSSYALTSLVIFFLQNTNPPVLPTLQTLKDLTDQRDKIDGWDCSFTDDIEVIPKTTNTNTAGQLFKMFLEFHKQISYNEMVLICRDATVVPIKEFREKFESTLENWDFKMKEMNVQDPFVLNHNITRNVTSNVKNELKKHLNKSSTAIRKCLKSKKANMALIHALDFNSVFSNTDHHSCTINLNPEMSSQKNMRLSDYLWCVHACQFVEKLLSDILFVELDLEQNKIMSEREFRIKACGMEEDLNSILNKPDEENIKPFEELFTGENLKHEEEIIESPGDSFRSQNIEPSYSFASQVLGDFDEINEGQNKRKIIHTEEHSAKRTKSVLNNPVLSMSENSPALDAKTKNLSFHELVLEEDFNIHTGLVNENETASTSNHGENTTSQDSDNQFGDTQFVKGNEIASTSNQDENSKVEEAKSNEVDPIDLGEIVFNCHARNIPLTGRRKTASEINLEKMIKDLELEKEVSKCIMERGNYQTLDMTFKCVLNPSISARHASVNVSFERAIDEKSKRFEFLCDFLKAFIVTMFKNDLK